jgi:hypothetical protein
MQTFFLVVMLWFTPSMLLLAWLLRHDEPDHAVGRRWIGARFTGH